MKIVTFLKTTVALASLAVVSGAIPTASQAQPKYNMCQLDTLPADVIERVTTRSDFEVILTRMFQTCPDAALSFTGAATASTGPGVGSDSGRDDGNNGVGGGGGPDHGDGGGADGGI